MSVLLVIVLGTVGLLFLRAFPAVKDLGRDFAVALRPLTLPFLVLAVVAVARGLPLVVATAAFMIAVLLSLRWIVLPEWEHVKAGFEILGARVKRVPARRVGVVAASPGPSGADLALVAIRTVLPPVVLVALALSPSVRAGGRGGFATAFAEGALLVLGVALLLRLVSFGRTPLRALCALVVFVLALRAFVRAGFIPGDEHLRTLTPALTLRGLCYVAACAFVLCAAGEVLQHRLGSEGWSGTVLRLLNRPLQSTGAWRGAAIGGLVATMLATAFLVTSVGMGMYVMSHARGDDPSRSRDAVPLAALSGGGELRPSGLSSAELAETYMPVFVYSSGQRWLPSPVADYLEDALLIGRNGTIGPAPVPAALPATCGADVAPPCYRLTIECQEASNIDCSGASQLAASDELHRRGAVYVRVLRKGIPASGALLDHPPSSREPSVFDYPGPFGDPIRTLVQYWLFYRYDEWTAPTMLGRLVQRHEADWEAITIGFSDDEPLFVAYSAHCGGHWLPWDAIQVAADVDPSTHPVVAVAEGSHANYDESQERRPPDWASCLGLDGAAFAALTYVWGIEDVTGDHYRLLPHSILLVDRDTSPMSFPGTWGGNDQTAIENQRGFTIGDAGNGPRSPPLRALWADPITTIFCSKEWTPRPCKGVRQPEVRQLVGALDDDTS